MPRILILTAGYGEGHNSAARALLDACAEQPDVSGEIIDLFALRAPRLNQLSRRGYIRLINTAPRLWNQVYRLLDRPAAGPWLIRALTSHCRVLGDLLAEKKPDVILSTYPVYAWLLNRLQTEGRCPCPHYTVVTDALTINSLWYRSPAAGWFVTDPGSASVLLGHGIAPARVHVMGFPVARPFADRLAHWQPPALTDGVRPRILFMINTAPIPAMALARELLRHAGWHITFTAGRNVALQEQLRTLCQPAADRTQILGWTDRIPQLLMTHHVVISKAGGATTQEAINALCPMIVSQIVPGQEEGNYELLRRHGAGAHAADPVSVGAVLREAFADNGALWQRWRNRLTSLARPSAARSILRQILKECPASALPGCPGLSPNDAANPQLVART